MNMKICERHASKYFGFLVFAFIIMDFLTIPAVIIAFVYLLLAYRDLFDRSLFGEEAYTYMAVPMSMKDVVVGKTIAACLYIMVSFILVWVALGVSSLLTGTWNMGLGFGNIGGGLLQVMSGYADAIENNTLIVEEIVYDRGQLISLSVALVLLPLEVLSLGILFCGVFQMGAIVRHLIDPQRNSGITTAGVVFGSTAVLLGIMAATTGVDMIISGDVVTIFSTVISIVVPVIFGVVLLVGSVEVRLLRELRVLWNQMVL